MKKTSGILAIVVGVCLGLFALTRHEEDKKILDLGKIELKNEQKQPTSTTALYYALSAIFIFGGAALTMGKDIR